MHTFNSENGAQSHAAALAQILNIKVCQDLCIKHLKQDKYNKYAKYT